ncbi:polyadenylate-binding 2 isoform X1 [Brachionus plicatilis]|uniref:Polyadenylate-binding 2 isoform X1 n=1 Tax=Brachionus plicatilis TaxID=10195 RepID=A0A3M7T6G7_BRAPC|nr:polyadenylate-binding 2 isoform X1 [Brachionus plicatilis]
MSDNQNDNLIFESAENQEPQESQTGGDSAEPMNEDADLFDIKQRVKGMDEEAARLLQLQNEMEQQLKSTNSPTSAGGPFGGFMSAEEKLEADARSIYVGNVDYSATAQELEAHFHGCGSINRVTILCDKFTGHPKGFAYIEFGDKDSVQTAMALDDSLFKGRQIKVVSKRTNRPGISSTDRGRGRGAVYNFGYMGRGRGGYGMPRGGGYAPFMRSYRGRVVKGRGAYGYAPY